MERIKVSGAAAPRKLKRIGPGKGGKNYLSRIITVFSTKGGSGKSTVAVNLAAALGKKGFRVALVDVDLQFGDVGIFMNVPRCETFSDLAAEHELTEDTVMGYLYHHDCGVDVLVAPGSPELAELVKPEHIKTVASVLKNNFDYTIFDSSPLLDDNTITALELSDTIYFITNPEIPTLKNTRTCMGILRALGLGDKLRLILNKDGDSLVSRRDVQSALDARPVLCIPNDPKISSDSMNRGIPAVIACPRSKLARAITGFAEKGELL